MQMAIIGISGRMGRRLYEYYKDKYDIVGVDIINFSEAKTYKSLKDIPYDIDIVVDFSSKDSIDELKYAVDNNILTLSGTTGYDIDEILELKERSNNRFYWSANYAKGIDIFIKIIDFIKDEYEFLDFIEIHSTSKKDSPSGTAKMLARRLNISNDKIQSLRINSAPAIHELIFHSKNERIIIRHEAIDISSFIEGFDIALKSMLGCD